MRLPQLECRCTGMDLGATVSAASAAGFYPQINSPSERCARAVMRIHGKAIGPLYL